MHTARQCVIYSRQAPRSCISSDKISSQPSSGRVPSSKPVLKPRQDYSECVLLGLKTGHRGPSQGSVVSRTAVLKPARGLMRGSGRTACLTRDARWCSCRQRTPLPASRARALRSWRAPPAPEPGPLQAQSPWKIASPQTLRYHEALDATIYSNNIYFRSVASIADRFPPKNSF